MKERSKRSFAIWEDISSYFKETTVHGFRYVAEGENLIEKLVWTVIIIAGFCVSGWFIVTSFQDWASTPLETTIDRLTVPIEELFEPATTVCNPEGLKMPRRARWMYMEKLLNWIDKDKGNTCNISFRWGSYKDYISSKSC